MKVVFIFLTLFINILNSVYSQEITINGNLTDINGNSIPFANVFLDINPEIGTLTDYDGNYKLIIKEDQLISQNNKIFLVFSALGFEVKKLDIEKKVKIVLNVILNEKTEVLNEIILSSESNASKEYTLLKLDKTDIYTNPTASADPLKAILIYPYSTNIDETANPSFRGSNPDKSRVILNGVPVFSPVRNNQINGLGNFSLFNTEMVDRLLIYPSNPPLIYGNSSAGMVELETSKEVIDISQASLSLASAGFLISRDFKKNSFFQLYSNKQFSNLFLDVNNKSLNFLNDFSSFDTGLNLRISNKDNSHFNIFTYLIKEDFEARSSILNTVATNKASRKRFFMILNYHKIFDKFKIAFNNGYDYSKSPVMFSNISLKSNDISYYSSLNFSFNLDDFFIKTGLNYNHLKRNFVGFYPDFYFALTNHSPVSNINNQNITNIFEGYIYGKINFNNFIISGAVRKNIPLYNSINTSNFQDNYMSYQSFLRWNLNKNNNFILSAGKYHSYSNPNIINQRISLNSSFQTSLDYTYQKKNTQIKASIYSKKENGITNDSFDFINNSIDDRTIYGFEFQFEKDVTKNLKLNASYTFVDSKLDLGGQTFRSSNDLNYFIKGVISYVNRDWNLAFSTITRPGTYYTDVVSSVFNSEAMAFEPMYSETLNLNQFGSYFRADFSANKSFNIKSNKLITYFSINNIFNRKNEQNVFYSENYDTKYSEFFPGRLIYFGIVYLVF